LKGSEKAAAILSLLGDELSHKILSYLPEETAVSIIGTSEKLKVPGKDALLQLISEFNDHMSKEPEARPQETVENLPPVEPGSPLEKITRARPAEIAKALEIERPEIAAYVLSHLPVEKIYETMNLLKENRGAIEERLLSIKDVPISKELQERILKTISERLV